MSRKNKIVMSAVCLFMLLMIVCLTIVLGNLKGLLTSQQAARRWRGESDERFAQLSCFMPVGQGIDLNTIRAFEDTVDAKLLEASLEAPESGALWVDAWSTDTTLTVSGSKGSASDVPVIAVGGEFFQFHPLNLVSGAYMSAGDIMQDRIIIDTELAWRLFGASNVAGMTVTIDGEPYIVAGVIERDDDFADKKAYISGAGMFMSYDKLVEKNKDTSISCYEIVMPDPISGFALSVAESEFTPKDGMVVENSARYSISALLKVIGSFGERSMRADGILLPYWENAARLIENHAAIVLLLMMVCAVFPVLCLLILLVKGKRRLEAAIPVLKERMITAIEDSRDRRRQRREALSGTQHEAEIEGTEQARLPEAELDEQTKMDIQKIIDEVLGEQQKGGSK